MTTFALLAVLTVAAPLGAVWIMRGPGRRSHVGYTLQHIAGRIPVVRVWNPKRRSWRQAFYVWTWMLGFFPVGLILRARAPEGRYKWRVVIRNAVR